VRSKNLFAGGCVKEVFSLHLLHGLKFKGAGSVDEDIDNTRLVSVTCKQMYAHYLFSSSGRPAGNSPQQQSLH
jgi:hypothetical protein